MICPLTGSSLYNQLMRWKKKKHHCNKQQIRHSKSSSHTSVKWWIVRVPCLHGCCNFGSLMLPYQRSWPMMPQNPQYSLIHWTQYFFFGGGVLRLTKCILGPWQSSPKLFRIYNTMLGRERENADEISSCCSAKAICMTSLSWKSHSRARKWLPLRWNLSFQRPVGCEWEVRFLNLCLKPSDVTPWQKSLKG